MIFTLAGLAVGCGGHRPATVGQYNGQFAACPNKPNCVNSQAEDGHSVEPYLPTVSLEKTWEALLETIKTYKDEEVEVIVSTENYIYAEFRTRRLKFVDDVEFYLNSEKNRIEIRSASRLGYGDMGANRKRVENVRESLRQRGLVVGLNSGDGES